MNIQKMSHKITIQKGTNMERKCFYYEENTEKPILAAGVLFIKEENGKKYILMQKVIEKDKPDKYEDFGGKIDLKDDIIVDTISRELGEELNWGLYEKVKKKNIYLDTTEKLKNLILENIVKLIYQKNKNIDISTKNNYALFLAHKNKHSNVVNWLKSLIV